MAATIADRLPADWRQALASELGQTYLQELAAFLEQERASQTVYPPPERVFAALQETPFQEVRVVLLGQDPYHGQGQAHGLAFSVPAGVRKPPSLNNIFKELKADLNVPPPSAGDLTGWARQGVLLLNAALTVRASKPGSHSKCGWLRFTDAVLKTLSQQREGLVFVLWGGFARKKKSLIDGARHTILEAAHPSPLSAHNGFFGTKPFSQINAALRANGQVEIRWAETGVQAGNSPLSGA